MVSFVLTVEQGEGTRRVVKPSSKNMVGGPISKTCWKFWCGYKQWHAVRTRYEDGIRMMGRFKAVMDLFMGQWEWYWRAILCPTGCYCVHTGLKPSFPWALTVCSKLTHRLKPTKYWPSERPNNILLPFHSPHNVSIPACFILNPFRNRARYRESIFKCIKRLPLLFPADREASSLCPSPCQLLFLHV